MTINWPRRRSRTATLRDQTVANNLLVVISEQFSRTCDPGHRPIVDQRGMLHNARSANAPYGGEWGMFINASTTYLEPRRQRSVLERDLMAKLSFQIVGGQSP
jgi:hypothetical protein